MWIKFYSVNACIIIINHFNLKTTILKQCFLIFRTIKECLCVTESLNSLSFQGIPLRERDLACLAKVTEFASLKSLTCMSNCSNFHFPFTYT